MYNNRQFAIFATTELSLINFNEVLETSAETVRTSTDNTKTFVKWDGITPPSVETLTTIEGFYTYEEMLAILSEEEWTTSINTV